MITVRGVAEVALPGLGGASICRRLIRQGAMPHDDLPPSRPSAAAPGLFAEDTSLESTRLGEILRKETVGGIVLVVAAVVAVVWANSPGSGAYFACVTSSRPGALGSAPEPGGVGRRRPARDLLLPRRPGAQARVRRRRAAEVQHGDRAGRRRVRAESSCPP